MKKSTKLAVTLGCGLMMAAFINLWMPLGVVAAGLWVFAFVYDGEFRGKFL